MATLAQIYDWFMTAKKPTQAQFWSSWGSFRHKDESIPQSDITNLTNVLNAKAETSQLVGKVDKVDGKSLLLDSEIERLADLENQDLSLKADLVDGQVPASQLPSYVDDVLDGQYISSTVFNNVPTGLPYVLDAGKIYVDIISNITYRWSGTVLIPIGSSLALGETASTAYRGDRGAQSYNFVVSTLSSGLEFLVGQILKLKIAWFNGFTIAQRNAITSPQEGMLIYVNEVPKGFQKYESGTWVAIGSNLFNSDLTLTANRNHNLGTKKISFTNGDFQVPALMLEQIGENSKPNKIGTANGLDLKFTNKDGIIKKLAFDEFTTQIISSGGNYNNLEITADLVIFTNTNAQAIINGVWGKSDFLIWNYSSVYEVKINHNSTSITGNGQAIILPTASGNMGVKGTARITKAAGYGYLVVDAWNTKYRPEFGTLAETKAIVVNANNTAETRDIIEFIVFRDGQNVALSKAELNTLYPPATTFRGFTVICNLINTTYRKIDNNSNDWDKFTTTLVV